MTFSHSPVSTHRSRPLLVQIKRTAMALLATSCLLAASVAMAVVCPMTNHMPSGSIPVGHDKTWIKFGDSGEDQLVQWWYPADPKPNDDNGGHIYSELLQETLQANPSEAEPHHPAVRDRYTNLRQAAFNRGVPLVRFNHMLAARMLAARVSKPRTGDWPVIWLDGDAAFADELASHGMLVVSTPKPFGSPFNLEQRVQAARAGIEETRKRFQVSLQRMGLIGMLDGGPVAARLNGYYPQVAGLVVAGDWPSASAHARKRDGYWLDASEIVAPTLHIFASDVPPNTPPVHPFNAPFASIERWHTSDVDINQLVFGIQEYCAPKYQSTRVVDPLQILVTQREMRIKLDTFFTDAFGIEFKTPEIVLTEFDKRRLKPRNISIEKTPASRPAPPNNKAIAEALAKGGVGPLLAGIDAETRALLPVSWWLRVLAQIEFDNIGAQTPVLLKAWQDAQPESGTAALQWATRSDTNSSQRKTWKHVRKLLKADTRISDDQRQQMLAVVEQHLR